MAEELARVERLDLPAGRRVVVISDVHGNVAFFNGLLEQVGFSTGDTLILLGDLLEKGVDSLTLLRHVMDLSRRYDIRMVCGNCDNLAYQFVGQPPLLPESFYIRYLGKWGKKSILHQMAAEVGLPLRGPADYPALQAAIPRHFPGELAFLRSLPTMLVSDRYLFVHGGVPREDRLEALPAWPCMKDDDFVGQYRSFSRWVVVGHWPVTLYRPHHQSARPLVLPHRHIVSIDGGCNLKCDGQLNALLFRWEEDPASYESYDGFPLAVAADGQAGDDDCINIRWSQNPVEVLEYGPEFCRCRHLASGRILDILTDYLYEEGGVTRAEDCTDHKIALSPGDVVSVVRRTSQGALVKRDGLSGWYTGRLLPAPADAKPYFSPLL